MRPTIVIGSALTAALTTMLAAVAAGVVAVDQTSVSSGVITRAILVVAALAVTAFGWWMRMRPTDAPEALLLGLVLGWLLNPQSWVGASFVAQLVTDITIGAVLIDLVLWAGLSFLLVLALSRTTANDRAR